LDYNELKIRVLSLFEPSKDLDSQKIRDLLSGMKVQLSDKAVEMALLRFKTRPTRQDPTIREIPLQND